MSIIRRCRHWNWSALTAICIMLVFMSNNYDINRTVYVYEDGKEPNLKSIGRNGVNRSVPISDNDIVMSQVFAQRRKQIRDACLLDNHGHVRKLLIYRPARLSYCVVPKAGCTYWKRIFRFLNGDIGPRNVSNPFKINRMIAHYGAYKHMGNIMFNNRTDRYSLANTSRLLVARDPYSRLWSVYLDKFLLPDFWRTHGQIIYKQKLKYAAKSNTKIEHLRQVLGKNSTIRYCVINITFEDFIRYIVNVESRGYGSNEHWVPISKLCNPCQYNPDYVSKMETFSQDAEFVLKKVGLQRILKFKSKSQVKDELEMLIKYNFQLLGVKFYKKCISTMDMCKRLWHVFQVNGYISIKTPFPELLTFRPSLLTKDSFLAAVIKVINSKVESKQELRHQKHEAMDSAYRKLPISILRMIPYIYEQDFKLFGYDPYPYGVFKNHKKYIRRKQ